jgi:hypothetical protein
MAKKTTKKKTDKLNIGLGAADEPDPWTTIHSLMSGQDIKNKNMLDVLDYLLLTIEDLQKRIDRYERGELPCTASLDEERYRRGSELNIYWHKKATPDSVRQSIKAWQDAPLPASMQYDEETTEPYDQWVMENSINSEGENIQGLK